MQYETLPLLSFHLLGIAVRTTNNGGKSQQDIGALWQRFYKEGIRARIPNKESNAIYCVYTDYAQDAAGAYTTLLGCKVSTLQPLPEGFTGLVIPKATYHVYTAAGPLPDSVLATWRHIWQTPLNRAYTADFDVYVASEHDANAPTVKTYLSVY